MDLAQSTVSQHLKVLRDAGLILGEVDGRASATAPNLARCAGYEPTSTNKGPVAARRAFYDALPSAFAIPAVRLEVDSSRQDKQARGVDLIGRYPGVLTGQLAPTMSPFVRFEIGRARVVQPRGLRLARRPA